MKSFSLAPTWLLLALFLPAGSPCQSAGFPPETGRDWITFPDNSNFKVLGLPWFGTSSPKLWRMPAAAMDSLPKGVQGRSKCPSGGRILLRSTSTRLALRLEAANDAALREFATYVNGRPCTPARADKAERSTTLVLFQDLDSQAKEIVIYLPHLQEVRIQALGVDPGSRFGAPDHHFADSKPLVFYGSSVCQGSGAASPGQTYPAIVARELNLDFVNLGFGGAGKAETNVVELVNSLPACGYVFDLGKSYGQQDATAFKSMLLAIRRAHPGIPMVVITPITSVKEVDDPAYSNLSRHTRAAMRAPAQELIQGGDKQIFLVEGEDLLGFTEQALLSRDGVHPSDQGYGLIAKKLIPLLRSALAL